MAWGKKKNRELEYRKTGQAAALKPGDLGANDVYLENETGFQASWEQDSESADDELESEIGTLAD